MTFYLQETQIIYATGCLIGLEKVTLLVTVIIIIISVVLIA